MNRQPPTHIQILLAQAESADWHCQAHIDNGGDRYDLRWHGLQASAHRAWDAYYAQMHPQDMESP